MMWLFAVLVVLVIGAAAVVAVGPGAPLGRAYDDRPDVRVQADGPLTAADLRDVRFSTAVRGYRASEVDALLERLAAELDQAAGRGHQRPGTESGYGAGPRAGIEEGSRSDQEPGPTPGPEENPGQVGSGGHTGPPRQESSPSEG